MYKNMYLSIGYPLGAMEIDRKVKHYIQLDNKIISVDIFSYCIWGIFFEPLDIDTVYQKINANTSVKKEQVKESIGILIKLGLIVLLNTYDTIYVYENLKKHVIVKQGLGIGLKKNSSKYFIKTKNEIEVEFQDYIIWMNADGVRNIESLTNEFQKQVNSNSLKVKESFLDSIFYLYKRGLLYIVK